MARPAADEKFPFLVGDLRRFSPLRQRVVHRHPVQVAGSIAEASVKKKRIFDEVFATFVRRFV